MRYKFLILVLLAIVLGAYRIVSAQARPDQPHVIYLPVVNKGDDTITITASSFDLSRESDASLTFSPASGKPDDTITIRGEHFTGVVLVLFGNTPAVFTVVSDDKLTAIMPAGATNGKISVVTLAASGDEFVVTGGTTETATATNGPEPSATPSGTVAPTAAATETATGIPSTPTDVIEPTDTAVPGTATATTVAPTATPTVPGAPTATPGAATSGIWISKAEVMALPMSGPGWNEVLGAANGSAGSPSLSNQDSKNNVLIMAKALVYARTGTASYHTDVISALRAIATGNLESGARALALGRELAAYVIAADLIDLRTADPALDSQFRTKIKSLLTFKTGGGPGSLIECQEQRPNNWGRHCGASRIAVDLYLGDKADLDRAAKVFHGWLGDRGAYVGFKYGDLSWQANPSAPVGVNPVGATIQGHDVSGAQPDDMRRGGSFKWPPSATGYPWEALQGAVATAHMLNRAGYPAWQWNDKAMLRAVQFLYSIGWAADGDDRWQIWIVNRAYGVNFPTTGGGAGKNAGWTQWTHR